jgi:hypothetical protein
MDNGPIDVPAFPPADGSIGAHVVNKPKRLKFSFKCMKFLLRRYMSDQIDIVRHADRLRAHIGDEQTGCAPANKHQCFAQRPQRGCYRREDGKVLLVSGDRCHGALFSPMAT